MPTGLGLLRQKFGGIGTSYVWDDQGAGTVEVVATGKTVAIYAFTQQGPGSGNEARLENQAGDDLWIMSTDLAGTTWLAEGNTVTFPVPLISTDGLQIVFAGAGNNGAVLYEIINTG